MSMAFHPETDGLSENSNKMVVRYLCGFATYNQANWDDYLPLAEYAYNSSVHRSTKQTPFDLDLGYEPRLPVELIAELHRPQANESAKSFQGWEMVERLKRILGVARDELRDAQDKQTGEANKSRRAIDAAITAGAKVFLDPKDLPITYANVNPTRCKLVHRYIGSYISKMYFSHWKTPGVSERMWSVNLDASISGEYQTLRGHSSRSSE